MYTLLYDSILLAVFTVSPITVYSILSGEPIFPTNASPVFIAIPISDAEPVMNYLFFRKKSFLDNEKIYQTFIETALSLIPTLQ